MGNGTGNSNYTLRHPALDAGSMRRPNWDAMVITTQAQTPDQVRGDVVQWLKGAKLCIVKHGHDELCSFVSTVSNILIDLREIAAG